MKTQRLALGISGLISLTIAGGAGAQEGFATADAQARAGSKTTAGKAHAELVGKNFGLEHSVTIQRCAKETKRPDLIAFDLLMRFDASGVVQEALVKPETNLARCVQGKMVSWRTAEPPETVSWVKVQVNLKKK
jgi:hypothetical protein